MAAAAKWVMITIGGMAGGLRILWEVLRHPLTAFKKTPRDDFALHDGGSVPPACLLDPSLGTHEYVTANGIKFHYVCAGDKSKPLMLCLHGFPEFWFSWRHQLREFSKDYHVVAIDMRGYGGTERPPNKLDYTFDKLNQDIVELVPALGYSKCTLVAHDGGAIVAWRVISKHPELIDKFIAMNGPHPKVFAKHFAKSWKQPIMSWYVFMFQLPKLPELFLSMSDYEFIDDCFTGKNKGIKNRAGFPSEVVEAYKYVYSQPGALSGPINYYRCMLLPQKSTGTRSKMIDVPTLLIWGDCDGALCVEMADMHEAVVSNITIRHIPDCSHWVQQDAPDLVNQYMREFLQEY